MTKTASPKVVGSREESHFAAAVSAAVVPDAAVV